MIGQVNAPELQRGLVDAIRRLGGEVVTGVTYQDTTRSNGRIEVKTDKGTYLTNSKPLLAMGAQTAKMPVDTRGSRRRGARCSGLG